MTNVNASKETQEFRDYFNANNGVNETARRNTGANDLASIALVIDDTKVMNNVFEGNYEAVSTSVNNYLYQLVAAMQNSFVNEDDVDEVVRLCHRTEPHSQAAWEAYGKQLNREYLEFFMGSAE